jgi:hypothetical protein
MKRTISALVALCSLCLISLTSFSQEQTLLPVRPNYFDFSSIARVGAPSTIEIPSELYEKKGDKERIYKVPIETMWTACMKTAAEDNVIDYSNEKEGIITFKTGTSMASWGFRISLTLSKLDGRTRIKLTTQKTRGQLVAWGAGGRTVDKFFKALDKRLTEPH